MKTSLEKELSALLSDYQVLYQKLRAYHWTVTGPLFFGLHAKFEQLYDDAAEKVDALAERLAARGEHPPTTLRRQLELARLREDAGRPGPLDMVRAVAVDLETLNASLRSASALAVQQDDSATADLLTGFADGQEKTLWMLRAFLAA
jgi:starvation-inducible DNA-binding protein